MTHSEKLQIRHTFKAIALSRRQIKDFEAYKKYEDELIQELIDVLDLGEINE